MVVKSYLVTAADRVMLTRRSATPTRSPLNIMATWLGLQ